MPTPILSAKVRQLKRQVAPLVLLWVALGSLGVTWFVARDREMATAQTGTPSPLIQLTEHTDGLAIRWQISVEQFQEQATMAAWPQTEFGGFVLPFLTLLVAVPPDGEIDVQIDEIDAVAWPAELLPASEPTMRSPDGELLPNPEIPPELPSAPLLILRDGVARGTRIAVIGLSPIFGDVSDPQFAARLAGVVSHATLRDAPESTLIRLATPQPASPLAPANVPPGQTESPLALPTATVTPTRTQTPTSTFVTDSVSSTPPSTSTPTTPPTTTPLHTPQPTATQEAPASSEQMPERIAVAEPAGMIVFWLGIGALAIAGAGVGAVLWRNLQE